jgi:hypothetical protein
LLREAAAVRIPGEPQIAGATLTPEGTVLLWGSDAPTLTMVTPAGLVKNLNYPANSPPQSVCVDAATGEILVFSKGLPRVVRVTPEGHLLDEYMISLAPTTPNLAVTAFLGPRLVAGTIDRRDGVVRLEVVHRDGSVTRIRDLPFGDADMDLPGSGAEPEVRLSSNCRMLVVTAVWPPHTSWVLEGNRVVTLRPTGRGYQRFLAGTGERAFLAALGAVRIPGGYLGVIADLNSHRRLLIRFDAEGNTASATEVPNAFGLIGANEQAGTVVALRSAPWREVVWYQIVPPSGKPGGGSRLLGNGHAR